MTCGRKKWEGNDPFLFCNDQASTFFLCAMPLSTSDVGGGRENEGEGPPLCSWLTGAGSNDMKK